MGYVVDAYFIAGTSTHKNHPDRAKKLKVERVEKQVLGVKMLIQSFVQNYCL